MATVDAVVWRKENKVIEGMLKEMMKGQKDPRTREKVMRQVQLIVEQRAKAIVAQHEQTSEQRLVLDSVGATLRPIDRVPATVLMDSHKEYMKMRRKS